MTRSRARCWSGTASRPRTCWSWGPGRPTRSARPSSWPPPRCGPCSSRLATVYAPQTVASFGAGEARIDVRAVAADGSAAYRTALAADVRARQVAGLELLADPRVTIAAPARAALAAGRVDARLLITLAALAANEPVQILAFSDDGPGASPGHAAADGRDHRRRGGRPGHARLRPGPAPAVPPGPVGPVRRAGRSWGPDRADDRVHRAKPPRPAAAPSSGRGRLRQPPLKDYLFGTMRGISRHISLFSGVSVNSARLRFP